MNPTFEMVAKTFQGLEDVLARELTALGALDVTAGKRMVSFRGDLAMMYKANMCCRTALRILKPFHTFEADDPESLYAGAKAFDWSSLMNISQTFSIDSTVFSEEFRNSQYVTYRVKDAVVDWFRDHDDNARRPRVCVEGADIIVNVHISGKRVTLSLDSSGESLHKRGWRKAQTEAPISEVLAAGILLLAGYDGSVPFVDPMCGSGTFAIEAAMIAAGIKPGIYREHFAFENWPDFDADLLAEIYDDDSTEREPSMPIVAADLSPQALAIAATNARSAGVERYITFEKRNIADWTQAPSPAGILVTNPPYGRRIGSDDMRGLYSTIGRVMKHVFTGYHAWIIGYEDVYFHEIGLAPSQKIAVNNGGLDCELREYVIFEGRKDSFRAAGGRIKSEAPARAPRKAASKDGRRPSDGQRGNAQRKPRSGNAPFGGRDSRKPFAGKDNRAARSERPDRNKRPFAAKEQASGSLETIKGRRAITIGREPSISAENEIVVNRPMWRARKKHDDKPENTDK